MLGVPGALVVTLDPDKTGYVDANRHESRSMLEEVWSGYVFDQTQNYGCLECHDHSEKEWFSG